MKELKDYSLPAPNEWVRDDGEVVTTHQKVPFGEHKPKYTLDQLKQMIECTGLEVEYKRLESGGWDATVLDGNGSGWQRFWMATVRSVRMMRMRI